MTRKELGSYLKSHLVPGSLYSLKGRRAGRICLEETKGQTGYDVYFSEAKKKVGLIHYDSEEAACLGMLGEIEKTMRGIYGVQFCA